MPPSTRGSAMSEPGAPLALRAGAAALTIFAALALFAPWLAPRDPTRTLDPAVTALAPPLSSFRTLRLASGRELATSHLARDAGSWRLEGPGGIRHVEPDRVDARQPTGEFRFWLGADGLGRDVAARWLYGARISLAVAAAAVALALAVGIPAGLLAGLAPGAAGRFCLAGIELAQAFPRLFLLVVLVAVLPAGAVTTVAILGLSGWMPVARLVRAETRRLRAGEFVAAARCAGVGPLRLALRHLLPNMTAPIAVEASLAFGGAVTAEAALSFLGLGVPAPTPSWGNLIAEGRDVVASAWWIAFFPGLALVLVGVACTLVGEGLRSRWNARAGGRAS